MSTYVQSAVQMHAHKCVACEKNGKEVIWVHPDTCRGKVAAHKCPECGTIEWKQCNAESAKLPQVKKQDTGINWNTVFGYILFAVFIALVAYTAFLYVKQSKEIALPGALTGEE